MASRASGAESTEFAPDVAVRTRCGSMFPGQRELGRIVIKDCSGPLDRRMARLARLREPRGRMVGIGRLLEIWKMAGGTRRSEPRELSAYVAARTCSGRVLTGQREFRGVVVKYGSCPLRRRVTGFAGLREARRDMVRIGRLLEVRQVAGRASCSESAELTADMATCARCGSMFSGQRELRGIVIEHRPCPLRRCMARFAGLRKARRRMVGIRRLLEVRQVAGPACGAKSAELAADMAASTCG
jgi:hypothetical protein